MAPVTVLMTLMGLEIGGAETHAVVLARHLKEMGYRVVLVSGGGVYEETIARYGIRHYRVVLDKKGPLDIYRAVAALRSIIAAEGVTLLHAHARIPAFVSDLAAKLEGINFITTAHAMFSTEWQFRYLSRWGEKTIAISPDIKEHLIKEFGVAEENIFLIPNGIDTDTFNPGLAGDLEAELALEQNGAQSLVIYVSRLDETLAGVAQNLMEACARVYGDFPSVRLLIVGGGEGAGAVAAGAAEVNARTGVELVRLLGARTDVNRLMAGGDLVVGVSRVALEAMSCARNVILAGGEGYGGLIGAQDLKMHASDNFTGRRFKAAATVANLERSLKEFLLLPPERKEHLGKILRQYIVENYGSMKMARETAEVYAKVLNG